MKEIPGAAFPSAYTSNASKKEEQEALIKQFAELIAEINTYRNRDLNNKTNGAMWFTGIPPCAFATLWNHSDPVIQGTGLVGIILCAGKAVSSRIKVTPEMKKINELEKKCQDVLQQLGKLTKEIT